MKEIINENTCIADIINKYPNTISVFFYYGLSCACCALATKENLKDGAKTHGIIEQDLNRLVADLNEAANSKEPIKHINDIVISK